MIGSQSFKKSLIGVLTQNVLILIINKVFFTINIGK